jgi:hypothetical protein
MRTIVFQFLNQVVNPIVRAILRSPLHSMLSNRLARLTYTRGNGESRTIPVGYAPDGDSVRITVGAADPKRWWRAVRRNPDVTLAIRRARRTGRASVTAGDPVRVDVRLGGRDSVALP